MVKKSFAAHSKKSCLLYPRSRHFRFPRHVRYGPFATSQPHTHKTLYVASDWGVPDRLGAGSLLDRIDLTLSGPITRSLLPLSDLRRGHNGCDPFAILDERYILCGSKVEPHIRQHIILYDPLTLLVHETELVL